MDNLPNLLQGSGRGWKSSPGFAACCNPCWQRGRHRCSQRLTSPGFPRSAKSGPGFRTHTDPPSSPRGPGLPLESQNPAAQPPEHQRRTCAKPGAWHSPVVPTNSSDAAPCLRQARKGKDIFCFTLWRALPLKLPLKARTAYLVRLRNVFGLLF